MKSQTKWSSTTWAEYSGVSHTAEAFSCFSVIRYECCEGYQQVAGLQGCAGGAVLSLYIAHHSINPLEPSGYYMYHQP
jgi:hypothetical protein